MLLFLVLFFVDVLSKTTKLNLLVSLHEVVVININFIYLSLSIFALSFSLAYLMDVFVPVISTMNIDFICSVRRE